MEQAKEPEKKTEPPAAEVAKVEEKKEAAPVPAVEQKKRT